MFVVAFGRSPIFDSHTTCVAPLSTFAAQAVQAAASGIPAAVLCSAFFFAASETLL